MPWQIDKDHSEIQFSIRHMMIATIRGRFKSFSGNIEFDIDNPESSTVDVTIETASIDTGNEERDTHLKSPDFLDVGKFPTMTFVGKKAEKTSESEGTLTGDLTIRGVTREVTLDIEYAGQALSPWGFTSAGFSATTKIDREDFDLAWNQELESGGVLIGTAISISIELEVVKQEDGEAKAA